MSVTNDYLLYVLGQLGGLEDVTSRRMFGGVGLYQEARIFGIIAGDILYFKVDNSNRGDYEARRMNQFRPYANKPQVSMTYYEVPADILEDPEKCVAWARQSATLAAAIKDPGPRRQRKEQTRKRG